MRIRLAGGLLMAVALAACGGGESEDTTTTTMPTSTTIPPTTASTVTTTTLGSSLPDIENLARATVQVVQLDSRSGSLELGCFSGSGSIIDSAGLVLTNAHVLELDERCPYDTIGIAVLERSDQPPDLMYLADLLVIDSQLDLAVVRIAADLNGDPVEIEFPFLRLGDSDLVGLGDQLQVLGYPGIGGDTITLTRGAVSGFTEQRDIEGRAWIKTDAGITGGNSGGAALSTTGQLIGVPSIVSSGANADVADCRVIQDTNGDGFLDSDDTCLPVGGFINGIRPINLARPLIEEAATASPIPIIATTPTTGIISTLDASFGPISFSTGVTESDEPTDLVTLIPSGSAERICAFWDYEGMVDGIGVDALWYLNQEFVEAASYIDSEWAGGRTGNWWVCFISNEGPLDDGIYELILNVQGDRAADEAIVVGGDTTLQTFELVNDSPETICFVFLSFSEAQAWGYDELGETEVIAPGASRAFEIPNGVYDFQAFDCNGDLLVEEFFINATEGFVFTYAG